MKIVDLAADQQITEPGFYRMPLSRHHGQPCDGVSVTSSILRQMELATPADVWAFHALNPHRWARKETDALRLGAAMAYLVEGGPELLLRHFKVHAEDKPRRPTPAQIAAYDEGRATDSGAASVDYWRAVDEDPDAVDGVSFGWLTAGEVETLVTMARVLGEDEAARAVMTGEAEITMAWRDKATGLWCLARPDTVSVDGAASDYKKINTQGRPFSSWIVDRRIEQHGYHMQMAFAAEGLEQITDQWPQSVGVVAQWDQRPHHVILREIGEECLRIGQWQNRRALARFAECLASGHWPGPGEHVGTFQPLESWWERMQAQMNTEEVK